MGNQLRVPTNPGTMRAAGIATDDLFRDCAADAGLVREAVYVGPCHSCGTGNRALVRLDDLETDDFAEVSHHA